MITGDGARDLLRAGVLRRRDGPLHARDQAATACGRAGRRAVADTQRAESRRRPVLSASVLSVSSRGRIGEGGRRRDGGSPRSRIHRRIRLDEALKSPLLCDRRLGRKALRPPKTQNGNGETTEMFRTIMALVLAAALAALVEPSRADDFEIPELEGRVGFRRAPPSGTAGEVRSQQIARPRPGSPADAGVQEGPRGQHGRPGQGRAGQHDRARPVQAGRHAVHHGGGDLRIHRHAGDDLHHGAAPSCGASSPTAAPGRRTTEPTYQGYSIGHWIDEDGDGRYDTLEVETRGPFKGPRVYDASGLPLHVDNESTIKERIFLDKSDPNLMHDVITVFDHALTRPWTRRQDVPAQPQAISELEPDLLHRRQQPGRSSARRTIS